MKKPNILLNLLIIYPNRIAKYFTGVGELLTRLIVGYVFMLTGWTKLNNLEAITQAFIEWGIPLPNILTPFVAGLEFFGGLLIIFGFLTRISSGGLAITMIVAIIAARFNEIDSLETFFGFEEMSYFVIFTWLAISGAGRYSIDYYIEKSDKI